MLFNIALIFFLYIAVGLFTEVLYKGGFNPFYSRKIAHILSGCIAASFPLLLSFDYALAVSIFLVVLAVVDRRRGIFKGVDKTDPDSFGTICFPLGVFFLILFFGTSEALLISFAILILALADSIAAMVGKGIGVTKIVRSKTLEGTVAFVVTSICLMLFAFGWKYGSLSGLSLGNIGVIVGGSILIALVELFSRKGFDNMFIPVLAGICLAFVL